MTEQANQGSDTVRSTVTYTLAANLENLTLTGTIAINGTGNASNNLITGNSAKNTLIGGAGSDRFNDKTLTDSLLANFDVITDFNATDDRFLVATARNGFFNVGAVTSLTAAGIAEKLTPTLFDANFAARFSFGSRTFVAINNAIAGFNNSTDALVEVTGLTGTLSTNNFVTV